MTIYTNQLIKIGEDLESHGNQLQKSVTEAIQEVD